MQLLCVSPSHDLCNPSSHIFAGAFPFFGYILGLFEQALRLKRLDYYLCRVFLPLTLRLEVYISTPY